MANGFYCLKSWGPCVSDGLIGVHCLKSWGPFVSDGLMLDLVMEIVQRTSLIHNVDLWSNGWAMGSKSDTERGDKQKKEICY
eukprot:10712289-Karenia_brevis.AAC.1